MKTNSLLKSVTPRPSFRAWMIEVDRKVNQACHLSYDDLPDQCYLDWYRDGVTSTQAARRAIKNAQE